MWFEIDVCGIIVKLRIKNYEPSESGKRYEQWCKCDSEFISDNLLDYKINDDEILLSCEVEKLESALTALLNDEMTKTSEIRFTEPDFSFVLYPKRYLNSDPQSTSEEKGSLITDVLVEWKVYFRSRSITDNYLCVTLARDEIVQLRDYLRSVTA